MFTFFEGCACPQCWHCPDIGEQKDAGLSTYAIHPLINFTGGTLDKNQACNVCHWKYSSEIECKNCQPSQPCHKHYASIYNGTLNSHMPYDIHCLYMRNAPYNGLWSNRPESIGHWYANQASTLSEAIDLLRRFTDNTTVHYQINGLKNACMVNRNAFWQCLAQICTLYFATNEPTSRAVCQFYNTLRCRF